MRKHNPTMAARLGRDKGDRTNLPQDIGHALANDKVFQIAANSLLRGMLQRGGFVAERTGVLA